MVLRGARLPTRRPADVGADSGPGLDVLLEDLPHLGGDPVRDHAMALRPAPVAVFAPAREDDLGDRHRLGVDATRGDRGVRRGHVERRHADRPEPERRNVGSFPRLQRRADAEAVRHRRHFRGSKIERQACIDGVVREQRRVRDRRVRGDGRVGGCAGRAAVGRRAGLDARGSRLAEPARPRRPAQRPRRLRTLRREASSQAWCACCAGRRRSESSARREELSRSWLRCPPTCGSCRDRNP